MNIGEAKAKIMVLLDEVDSSNLLANIEDYRHKLPSIFDSVQRELACFTKVVKKYADVQAVGGALTLPADCYELVWVLFDGERVNWEYTGASTISVELDGEHQLQYNGYPTKIDATTADSYEFEIAPEAQEALLYGVCAGLTINDEPEAYAVYYERYELAKRAITEHEERYPRGQIYGGIRI